MRIIGGTHRSRRLLAPPDRVTTRPIIDRVKQSLFDRIWSMGLIGPDSPGGRVLDIFSGTGSLGLEALSRGSEHCTFVEKDRRIRHLLKENLSALDLAGRATVLGVDAFASGWIDRLEHCEPPATGLIFCDPPYRMTADPAPAERVADLIARLAAVTRAGGVAVLRTEVRTSSPIVNGWAGPDSYRYGTMVLHFYERP